jgi:cell wall-associated NlpC family hydrolase
MHRTTRNTMTGLILAITTTLLALTTTAHATTKTNTRTPDHLAPIAQETTTQPAVHIATDAELPTEGGTVHVTPPPPPPPPEPEPEPVAIEATQDANEAAPPPATNTGSSIGAIIVAAARAQVGDAYVYGASGPDSWDCSGLTAYAYAQAGIALPHQSAAQAAMGTPVNDPQPGDLLYQPGHIAVYAGNGTVIEAATPATGVTERPIWQVGATFIRITG